MFRLMPILALIPNLAAADWSPHPLMFTYDATLQTCVTDPALPDLAATCDGALTAAYVLKRAVAWAAYTCDDQDLSTCSGPFEDEGLPAIAVRIATDVGCDATNVLDLPEDAPLPENHCISVASDIMIDEGVVPLLTDISCGIDWRECGELGQIHAAFWTDQVDLAAPADDVVNDLLMRNRDDCTAQAREIGSWAIQLDALECMADRSARLWADLIQTQQDQ